MSSSPRTMQRASGGCDATQAQSFSSSPFLCHSPESVHVVPQAAGQPYQARMLSLIHSTTFSPRRAILRTRIKCSDGLKRPYIYDESYTPDL